jgi:tetratricopeptide (TPR) repeat protein
VSSLRVLVLVGALAGVAHADGDVQVDAAAQAKADVFFQKGQQDYESGKFQAAIELFKDAYELVHDPIYLFNIAQSYRKAADCTNAADYYNQYLTASPTAENAAAVRGLLRELEPCVEQRKREHDAATRADDLARQARAQPSAAAETTVDAGATWRAAGLSIGGAGVVGIVIGIAYGVRSHDLQRELDLACATSCTSAQAKSLDEAGHRANTISAIGYIGGGVAVLAGAGLYVFGRSRVEHVTIAPVPGGAAIGATLRW